jgi:hypothetical protein
MLHYFKFRQDLFAPRPAKETYFKRGPGRGWPEECPPIRAANAFGFDLLANFEVTFVRCRSESGWRVEPDVVIDSDFDYAADEGAQGQPLTQQYAWFWQKGQKLPHVITDNVFEHIRDQVKISSFLFLRTDPNELLYMTEPPNHRRSFRTLTALVDTDWYPASYPWHTVIELDRKQKKITIARGEPLCRVIPVRRDTYFAQEMTPRGFDDFFSRGQKWLATHGSVEHEARENGTPPTTTDTVDISRTYVRQQVKSKFVVME